MRSHLVGEVRLVDMRKITFTKMVASGNDFVVIECCPGSTGMLSSLAQNLCNRKFGVGADGLLLVEKSQIADLKLRIFNANGSEAEMCGNGMRCIASYVSSQGSNLLTGRKIGSDLKIETMAGIIEARINKDVSIKLTEPTDIKLDIPLKINNRLLKVNFINTGVPHTVIFVEGLDKIDVLNLGRMIRYHKRFAPKGTNVDFAEVLKDDYIKMRTYERGVEDETLACGTGAVAVSIISKIKFQKPKLLKRCRFNLETKSGEVLKVYFNLDKARISDVWLEGRAKIVYQGKIQV